MALPINNQPPAFLFDMDGTLVDNMRIHEEIWLELSRQHNLNLTSEIFHQKTSGKTNAEITRMIMGEDSTPRQQKEFGDMKEALYRQRYLPQMEPIPGLVEFLESSRSAGIRLALTTTADRENVSFVLDNLDLRRFFEVVLSAEDVQRGKPDPGIYLDAAARLGIAPERCVVFEDSTAGIEGGHRAGMCVVALATTFPASKVQDLPGVSRVIHDYRRLDPLSFAQALLPESHA